MSNLSNKIEQAIDDLEVSAQENTLSEDQLSRIVVLDKMILAMRPAVETVFSAAEKNKTTQNYKQQYGCLPDRIKNRCEWEIILERLFANGGEKLRLIKSMRSGGELVGIDQKGRVMFKDKGTEPVFYGYDEKGMMIEILERNPEQISKIKKWANYLEILDRVLKDGYELFKPPSWVLSNDSEHDDDFPPEHILAKLSREMRQVEEHTKNPFVASNNRKEDLDTWLMSCKRAKEWGMTTAWRAYFNSNKNMVCIDGENAFYRSANTGAVRLLRV